MRKVLSLLNITALTIVFGISMSYAAKPVTYYTLTVASANPATGVAITVSPLDKNGAGNGTTQFTRSYAKGTVVSLTAPATAGGNNFQKWQNGGVDYATTQATSVTMSANTTMTAVFVTPPAAENCKDGIDNDLNGLIDCADPACATEPSCVNASPTHRTINADRKSTRLN